MKKLFFLFLISANILCAQKKNFTIKEAVTGLSSNLAIKNLTQLKWTGSTEYYSHVVNNDSQKHILVYSPLTFESEILTTLETLNKGLESFNVKKLESIPSLNWISHTRFTFNHEQKVFQFNSLAKDSSVCTVIHEIPKGVETQLLENVQLNLAYIHQDNLFVLPSKGKPIQISQDGSDNLRYGTSVHRDEFGISGGLFWSPNGNALAFYRMDQSMVEDYPVVNWSETPASVRKIKYPFSGRNSHQVTLGVYHIKTGNTVYMKTGEPKEQYLTAVTWSPDEKYIYIGLLNRDQNHLKLNQYDAVSGEFIKTLFEEKNEKYVEPQHSLEFLGDDSNQFVWWSQRDGYMHLYLYKSDGTLVKQLTKGNWIVNELLGLNKKTQEIIFSGTKESPLQKNIYAVNIGTAQIRNVSTTAASHQAQLSHEGNYLIDMYTSATIPRNIEIVNVKTKAERRILTAANSLEMYDLPRIDKVTLYASDSTVLYGKLIYPTGFDENRKYPLLVYLYNGPHVQLVRDAFPNSGNLWYDYMAQHGYFVFVMDGRGSSNRGFNFESATFRQLGKIEMEDQLKGIDYVKTLPFVDSKRLGVHGWSYGGFMTTSLMLKQPDVFKCGVAGGPVLDWSMYEVMYTERYMDTPLQNPEGYKSSLLLDKVKNLKGKLLMIHGTDDDVVVWQHSLKFIKKAVDEGVQLDYFVYPGHPHNVRGKDRVHLMQKISDYFDSCLVP